MVSCDDIVGKLVNDVVEDVPSLRVDALLRMLEAVNVAMLACRLAPER